MGKSIALTFHDDPGHAWLEVPRSMMEDYDVTPSCFSYVTQDGETFYLEEDCDAGLVIRPLQAAGFTVEFNAVYHGDFPGRKRGVLNGQRIWSVGDRPRTPIRA